jgi:hypothetical protein
MGNDATGAMAASAGVAPSWSISTTNSSPPIRAAKSFDSDVFAQDFGGQSEHGVTCAVAERVVDLLEAVEVDVEYGDARAEIASAGAPFLEFLLKIAAVWQPCQVVVQGRLFGLYARPLELGIARLREGLLLLQFLSKALVLGDRPS